MKPTTSQDIGAYKVKFFLEDDNSINCDCGRQSDFLILSIRVEEGDSYVDLEKSEISKVDLIT